MIGWGDNNYCTFADGYSHTWNVAGNAIRIFNLVGDLVYVNENPSFNNQINVATFTAGVYTVRVGTVAKKVIIK